MHIKLHIYKEKKNIFPYSLHYSKLLRLSTEADVDKEKQ